MKKLKRIMIILIAIILLIVLATMGIKEIIAVSGLTNNPEGYQVFKCATCAASRSGNIYAAKTKGCDSCVVIADANSTIMARTRNILGLSGTPNSHLSLQQLWYCTNGHRNVSTGCSYNLYGYSGESGCMYPGCTAGIGSYASGGYALIRQDYISHIFNNVYCVKHSQILDDQNDPNGLIYRAAGSVEINGDTATFYSGSTKIGEVTDGLNNIIAAILSQGVSKGEGYGEYGNYTETQKLLFYYWNSWVGNVGSAYGIEMDNATNGNNSVSVSASAISNIEQLAKNNVYYAKFSFMTSDWQTSMNTTYTLDGYKIANYAQEDPSMDYPGDRQNLIIVDNAGIIPKIYIPVEKVWDDFNNVAGLRPDRVKVGLYRNDGSGQLEQTLELSASNNWKGSFYVTQRSYSLSEISYYYGNQEVPVISVGNIKGEAYEYTSSYTGSYLSGYTLINRIARTQVSVTKNWDDNNDAVGMRPESLRVYLYNDQGQIIDTAFLSASNGWSYTFIGLQKYKAGGIPMQYTIQEVGTSGYLLEDMTSSSQYGYTEYALVNKLYVVDVPVTKIWVDEDNRDGIRPDYISVELCKTSSSGAITEIVKTATINKNDTNTWSYIFTNLPEFEINGAKINYMIREASVPTGYSGVTIGDMVAGYTITNTHIPEKMAIKVEKEWDDKEDFDELRPTSIQVQLYKNGTIIGTTTLNSTNKWTVTYSNLYRYDHYGRENVYEVKEVPVVGYQTTYTPIVAEATVNSVRTITYIITNTHIPNYAGYTEISGKVWLDKRDGKGNDLDGVVGGDKDIALQGIKVILKDASGNQFDVTSYAETDADGNYTIKVNYDNSENVYKLYENATIVAEKLKTAYVEFEYDGMKYTTVKNSTTGANTSKVKEDEATRNIIDKNYTSINASTAYPSGQVITASTQGVISFGTYTEKTSTISNEVLKYCDGNGNYIRTNINGAWNNVIVQTGYNCYSSNHTSAGHVVDTYGIEVTKIQNVNLGLFEREQPDVAIFSDLSKVIVTLDDVQYTYLYNVRGSEVAADGLQVKFQNKGVYTYRRPVDPADIAYIHAGGGTMEVQVVYEVSVANLSTTVPIMVNGITNYFDKEYTLQTAGWSVESGTDFNLATNGNLNIVVQPGYESTPIELTYSVSPDAIKSLLTQDATLNNAVEIQSYSTQYGANTLYAEQRTGGKTGNGYGGYDYNSQPGNANIKLREVDEVERLYSIDPITDNIIPTDEVENDTDFAPSFVLCKDENLEENYRIIEGTLWEDSQTEESKNENERLGNGLKEDGEAQVEGVKVELYDIATGEIAKLYTLTQSNEAVVVDAKTTTNAEGKYTFKGVVPGNYYIKFTYGNGRNYKSTILTGKVAELFNGNELDASNNVNIETTNTKWPLKVEKNVSVAIDSMADRLKIEDLYNATAEKDYDITASTKKFNIGFEHTIEDESNVNANGEVPGVTNILDVFNFGIIRRPIENMEVSKTVSHISLILANGQKLIDGDPKANLPYVKYTNDRIIAEIDTELIQSATLKLKYEINVTNNSEIDYDYTTPLGMNYYYYGAKAEGMTETTPTIKEFVDYMGADIVCDLDAKENSNWETMTIQQLKDQGLISDEVYNTLGKGDYQIFRTKDGIFENLTSGQEKTITMTASKVLANQEDDYKYDNHVEILKVDAKVARKYEDDYKEYTPGNYEPNYEPNGSKNEQDNDRVEVIINTPTGIGSYIMYVIAGLAGLTAIGMAIIFIKKKVLIK